MEILYGVNALPVTLVIIRIVDTVVIINTMLDVSCGISQQVVVATLVRS